MKNLSLNFTKISLLSLFLTLFSFSTVAQKGSGNVTKKTFKVGNFDGIKIGGAYTVYLRQGDNEDVTIIADDNFIANIEVTVSGGILKIRNDYDMKNPTELKAYITVKNLNSISLSGACQMESKNTIVTKSLSIKASGASEINMSMRCSELKISASGAANMKLSGDAAYSNIDASGASTVKADNLKSSTAIVESSGASTVKVDVSDALEAKASGASSILYTGAANVSMKESGAADIKKM